MLFAGPFLVAEEIFAVSPFPAVKGVANRDGSVVHVDRLHDDCVDAEFLPDFSLKPLQRMIGMSGRMFCSSRSGSYPFIRGMVLSIMNNADSSLWFTCLD